MSFFKRKEKSLIPPVASEQSARDELFSGRGNGNSTSPRPSPSTRSSATTYVPSRDGDPYANTRPSVPSVGNTYPDRYTKQDAVGDVYTRGQGQRTVDQDRNELFGGYTPPQGGSGRFFDKGSGAPGGAREPPPPGEETEEDVEGIKQQMRFTKQESVNSTRNALRLAREAEETARNTLGRLGDQSGMRLVVSDLVTII